MKGASLFLVCLFLSLSLLCTIHNLHSVYTQLLGLLSVSYSQTIKLLTVWLIVPQFDFRGIGEGSAESVSRCGEKVAHTCELFLAPWRAFVS